MCSRVKVLPVFIDFPFQKLHNHVQKYDQLLCCLIVCMNIQCFEINAMPDERLQQSLPAILALTGIQSQPIAGFLTDYGTAKTIGQQSGIFLYMKRLATILSQKWKPCYSRAVCHIRARMQMCIHRLVSLCIWGYRTKWRVAELLLLQLFRWIFWI